MESLPQTASHRSDTEEGNGASDSLGKNQAELGTVGRCASLGRNARVPFPTLPCTHPASIQELGLAPEIFICL